MALGAVISASHNPYQDNGIKVFSGAGHKFTEELERQVEAIVADAVMARGSARGAAGCGGRPIRRLSGPSSPSARCTGASSGAKLVVDCANGATTPVAARLFRVSVSTSRCSALRPTGATSTCTRFDASVGDGGGRVLEQCRLGVAFDGDGDRAIFADEAGRIVDGDAVMLMCARQLKAEGRLRGNTLVATVMSNIGLELALGDPASRCGARRWATST